MVLLDQKEALLQPQIVTLLSPIRDSSYLRSLVNPTSTVPDAGVGVIDNPFFFVAGHYPGGLLTPSAPEDRTYLVWFGSPAGTTNEKPQFSIFYAKVHPDQYKPGAPASQWLDPPVLLVSYDQISRDVVNWFNSNYPADASNGVGNSFSSSTPGAIQNPYNTNVYILCNSTYGCISSRVSPGNVTGTPELKQLHMVYDPLDDTVLMYFSIMVPNWNTNTKSIYVYKFPVSLLKSNQSINQYAVSGLTPTTTSTPPPNDKPYFLGGLTLDQAFTQSFSTYSSYGLGLGSVFSAPQFTISFDYMKLTAPFGYQPSNGYLPALLVAVEGYMPYLNYPHGDGILVTLLQDIHANPANPTVFRWPFTVSNTTYYIPFASHAPETDVTSTGVAVDKFGSILPMQSIGLNGGYTVPLTTPSRGDIKLSSMRVKLMYILPTVDTGGNIGLDGYYTPTPWFTLAVTDSIVDPVYPTMGLCRPYVTILPDGKAKVLLGGYHADNYIEGVDVYVDPKVLKPDYHKKLYALPVNFPILNTNSVITWYTGAFGMDPVLISNFGKKKVKVSFQGVSGAAYKFLGVMKWDPISAQYNSPISPVNANTGNYLVTTGNQYIQLTGIPGVGNSSIGFYVAQSDVVPNGNWANTQSNAEFEIELNNNIWALTLVYFAYRPPEVVLEDE